MEAINRNYDNATANLNYLVQGAINADQEYSVTLSSESLNSEIYIVKLITDTNVITTQLVVLK